ncbi:HNH endonuclease signature motif containing protein [soil metagenome]
MSSALPVVSDRDTVLSAVAGLEAAFDAMAGVSFESLTTPELVTVLSRLETLTRRRPVVEHRLLAQLVGTGSAVELGAKNFAGVLQTALRISRTDARRRLDEAADLGPRTALTGEPLAPRMPATAAAQAAGQVGAEHVKVIRDFMGGLPGWVDYQTRELCERDLAQIGRDLGPTELRKAADMLAMLVNPDGNFSDVDRARKRGITIGRQGADGMSSITGSISPELRATLEAAFSKLAAPGMCNPDDESPCVKGTPSKAAIDGDRRSARQRHHDALLMLARSMLASKQLGSHHGLPVTVVVSTTLAELESAAGMAVTGGGSVVPMTDLIRMAAHAHHYLAIFTDTGQALHLGRSKRCASPSQRIVLHSKERGCTFPGCDAPGYLSEVHHAQCDWAKGGETNIDELTFGCGVHNRFVKDGGWRTRKRRDGRTEWIPPPHLDTGQGPVNKYHHPEQFLVPDEDGDEPK